MFRPHLFVSFAFLFSIAFANFDPEDLDDSSFTLKQGNTSLCPAKIEINTIETNITAENIDVDDVTCTGNGFILVRVFNKGDDDDSSPALKFFSARSGQIGRFLTGAVQGGDITCGLFKIQNKESVFFLESDDDVRNLKWTDVYGTKPRINAETFMLDDDDRYMLLGDRCYFKNTQLLDRLVCFPSDANVGMQDGSIRRMDKLSIGDNVQVSPSSYSSIFAWTHSDSTTRFRFVQLSTKSKSISLTPSHFIYADNSVVAAGKVQIGMKLRMADGSFENVVDKRYVWKTGLYNPQTLQGDIVVDGIMATTYTSAIAPNTAHGLLAPVRALFSVCKGVFGDAQSVEL